MTRLFMDRAEKYAAVSDAALGRWATANFQGFSTYSRRGIGKSFIPGGSYSTVTGLTNSTDIYVAFPLLITGANNNFYFCLYDGTTVQCQIAFKNTYIYVYSGDGATLLASYPLAWTYNVWNFFSIHIKLSPYAYGEVHIRVNGTDTDTYTLTNVITATSGTGQASGFGIRCDNTPYVDFMCVWNNADTSDGWTTWMGDFDVTAFAPAADTAQKDFAQVNGGSIIFGDTTNNAYQQHIANCIDIASYTPTCGGTLGSLTLELNAAVVGTMQCALYESDGDTSSMPVSLSKPGTLIATTAAVVNPVAGANAFAWATTPTVQNGKVYFLAVWCSVVFYPKTNTTTSTRYYYNKTFDGNFPAAIGGLVGTASWYAFTAYATITPSNAGLVSDYSEDGATTYVAGTNAGTSDLYTLDPRIANLSGEILGLQAYGMTKKSDSGLLTSQMLFKSSSGSSAVLSSSSTKTESTSFTFTTLSVDKNPETVARWTSAELGNIQIGTKLVTVSV